MPPFIIVVGAGTIKGVHVPHAEWVVPFYQFSWKYILQELVPIVKCWSFTLQPPPSHEKRLLTINYFFVVNDHGKLSKFEICKLKIIKKLSISGYRVQLTAHVLSCVTIGPIH